MADLPISGLPAATVLNNPDLIAIEQAGTTKNLSGADLFASIGSGLTFSGLSDVEATYSNVGALTAVNSVPNGMEETTTLLTQPAANQFQIDRGTTSLLMQADLTVSGISAINQDATTTGNPTFASNTLSNAPVAGSDATRKDYVDSLVNGLAWKNPARASTTGTITLFGEQTIDTIPVVTGDRVLAQFQGTPADNGIYIVDTGAWTRSTDMDQAKEFPAAALSISEGAIYGGMAFTCTNSTPPTIGVTAITFVCFSGIINHNGTVGVQGGIATEYYHLQQSAYNNLLNQDQPLETTDSPTFVGGTLSGLTQGSVPFIGSGGVISQDNANLFWNNTSNRLGIGTSTPLADLDVANTTGSGALKTVLARLTDNYIGTRSWSTMVNAKAFSIDHIFFTNTNSSINFYRGSSSVDGFMTFATNNNTERVRIESGGNVGIGTTTPATALDVNGTVTATSLTASSISSGLVRSTAGLLSGGASVDLASEVTGTLPIASVSLLSGITSLSPGTGDNDKLVTQGYVNDNPGNPFDQPLNTTDDVRFRQIISGYSTNSISGGVIPQSNSIIGGGLNYAGSAIPSPNTITSGYSAGIFCGFNNSITGGVANRGSVISGGSGNSIVTTGVELSNFIGGGSSNSITEASYCIALGVNSEVRSAHDRSFLWSGGGNGLRSQSSNSVGMLSTNGFIFTTLTDGSKDPIAADSMVLDSVGSLGIGVLAPNATAKVQIDSTTKGFLKPVMNGIQRTAIISPATGLSLHNTSSKTPDLYTGSRWATYRTSKSVAKTNLTFIVSDASEVSVMTGLVGDRFIYGNIYADAYVGSTYHIKLGGTFQSNNNQTLTLRVRYGLSGPIIYQQAVSLPVIDANSTWNADVVFTITTALDPATIRSNGTFSYFETGGNSATEHSNRSTGGINSITDNSLEVTLQWGVASPTNNIACSTLFVDKIL